MNVLLTLLEKRLFMTLREPWQNVLCQLVFAEIINVVECFTVTEAAVFSLADTGDHIRTDKHKKSLQFCSSSENRVNKCCFLC